jgi:hypothetical protein
MSDQLYYTPTLEDLFVGYECERYNRPVDLGGMTPGSTYRVYDGHDKPEGWVRLTVTKIPVERWQKELRTRFLTREQIEAELGWKKAKHCVAVFDGGEFANKKVEYWLFMLDGNWIEIHLQNHPFGGKVFHGRCPSINEFRKIMTMVGIEKKKTVNV